MLIPSMEKNGKCRKMPIAIDMFMILHVKMLKLPIYALLSFRFTDKEEGNFLIRNELSTLANYWHIFP